jgi:hypothetical protein
MVDRPKVGASEFDRCLAEFEAAFESADAAPVSPVVGKACIGIERALMAQFVGIDLGRYYTGTVEDQIVFQLRSQLFLRRHFPGANRLGRRVFPDFGCSLPATVLGVPWTPRPNQEPWASGQPPIRTIADLENRPLPEFHTSGMMPSLLRTYAEMKRLMPASYTIGFPEWSRGPLGNAFYLAGAERALMSLYSDVDFFHRLMRYGMAAMKKWITDRSGFLAEPMPKGGVIWNDEISSENFSPQVYRELIAPYDVEYTEFMGGPVAFHSCGNTTALMESIAATAPWSFMHVSAWSDLDRAIALFPKTRLVVSLHPYREVLGCTLAQTQSRIRQIVEKCRGRDFQIAICELMPVRGQAEDMQRLKDVWSLCGDILRQAEFES